jgi:hypothetical protein
LVNKALPDDEKQVKESPFFRSVGRDKLQALEIQKNDGV